MKSPPYPGPPSDDPKHAAVRRPTCDDGETHDVATQLVFVILILVCGLLEQKIARTVEALRTNEDEQDVLAAGK